MTTGPAISVIVPCYNLGRYLDQAVDSVLAQSFDEVEILIVDDGSDDPETTRLLDGYDRPRTTVFRTEKHGLGAARNFLVERARGEFLCALDADDRLHPEYFSKAMKAFADDPPLAFVSTWLEAFGDEHFEWRQQRCDLAALLAENTVCTAAVVRREAVLAVGGYDEHMPHQGDEDWDLWLRLVAAGNRGAILPEVLFYYRRRPGSMSLDSDHGETHLDLVGYLLDKHRDHFRRHLEEVLLWKEHHAGELLSTNDRLERDISRLEGEVARRRVEVETLRNRVAVVRAGPPPLVGRNFGGDGPAEVPPYLGIARGDAQAAADECSRARAEALALRSSWSWRVTAPLRALYELLLGLKRGG